MKRKTTWLAVVAACAAWAVPVLGSAQTVGDLAARGECSTAGTEGIDAQLIRNHLCLFPGVFVRLDHPAITLASARVHPLVTATARDRIGNAADTTPLTLNSAFRTLAQQFVLYESGACAEAAEPGTSNHESGRAIDVDNWSEARAALIASGCTQPLPDTDPVHFVCGGEDMRMNSVLTFQMLWNQNNPGDTIVVDGIYGPQTRGRMQMTPVDGFPEDVCTPEMPDAGMPDAGPSDGGLPDGAGTGVVTKLPQGGCSCSAAGGPGALPTALPLLLSLVAISRRRR